MIVSDWSQSSPGRTNEVAPSVPSGMNDHRFFWEHDHLVHSQTHLHDLAANLPLYCPRIGFHWFLMVPHGSKNGSTNCSTNCSKNGSTNCFTNGSRQFSTQSHASTFTMTRSDPWPEVEVTHVPGPGPAQAFGGPGPPPREGVVYVGKSQSPVKWSVNQTHVSDDFHLAVIMGARPDFREANNKICVVNTHTHTYASKQGQNKARYVCKVPWIDNLLIWKSGGGLRRCGGSPYFWSWWCPALETFWIAAYAAPENKATPITPAGRQGLVGHIPKLFCSWSKNLNSLELECELSKPAFSLHVSDDKNTIIIHQESPWWFSTAFSAKCHHDFWGYIWLLVGRRPRSQGYSLVKGLSRGSPGATRRVRSPHAMTTIVEACHLSARARAGHYGDSVKAGELLITWGTNFTIMVNGPITCAWLMVDVASDWRRHHVGKWLINDQRWRLGG